MASYFLLTGCKLICTCPRGVCLAFSTEPVGEGDSRMYMPEEGMMTLDVLEKRFKANGQEITLALTTYRNGHSKVILLASSTHKRSTMDFVTTTERFGALWKNNRRALVKAAFALEFSVTVAEEKRDCTARTTNYFVCCLLQQLRCSMVTANGTLLGNSASLLRPLMLS